MTSPAPSATSIQDGSDQEPDPRTRRLHHYLLGLEHHCAAWHAVQRQLGLSATQASLLVAMPVLVGSLGRVPVEPSPTAMAVV